MLFAIGLPTKNEGGDSYKRLFSCRAGRTITKAKGGREMKWLKEMYEKLCVSLFCFLKSEEGQTLIEYALILVLIALVIIAMLKGTGLSVNTVYSRINSGLQAP